MKSWVVYAVLLGTVGGAVAQGEAIVLRDLEGKSPRKINKDELVQLLSGAKMSRVSQRGNRHHWTNELNGSLLAISPNLGLVDSRGNVVKTSTADGKWHISEDGRYCVVIGWKSAGTEQWCRFLLQTSDGYYAVRSDNVGTDKLYKLEIVK